MRTFKNDIVSNPGDPIKVIYAPVVGDDGSITLEEAGKENLDDYIQSHRESCDLNVIIQRFMNGEKDVMSVNMGSFGDFTKMPQTYAEILQLQIDSKRAYDSLPVELKQKFGSDQDKFFAMAGSKEWYEILGEYAKPKEVEKVVEEVGEVKE